MSWLINAAQVDKFRKSQKSLIILDASLHLPTTGRDAKQEFMDKHIVGAQFFDINLFSDPNSDLPYQLTHDEKFISEKLGELGLRNDYKIIFYDNSDLHSACRAVWMMKMFGHNPNLLYVLDGGFAAWEKQKGKVESSTPSRLAPKPYQAKWNSQFVSSLAQMKENMLRKEKQVIDLRHAARFAGGRETRPNLRSGRIPDSISLPFGSLFDKKNGNFLSLAKARIFLDSLGVDFNAPIIASCGSGVTATILDFMLDIMKHKEHTVYDGSWSEWGAEKLYAGEKDLSERPVENSLGELDPSNRGIL